MGFTQAERTQHTLHFFIGKKLHPIVAAFVQAADAVNRDGFATGDLGFQLLNLQLNRFDGIIESDAFCTRNGLGQHPIVVDQSLVEEHRPIRRCQFLTSFIVLRRLAVTTNPPSPGTTMQSWSKSG